MEFSFRILLIQKRGVPIYCQIFPVIESKIPLIFIVEIASGRGCNSQDRLQKHDSSMSLNPLACFQKQQKSNHYLESMKKTR